MAIERADSILDIPAISKEVDQYVQLIQKSQQALLDLFNTTKQFKDSNVMTLTQNTEKLSVSMQGSLQTTKAVTDANALLVKSIEALTAATVAKTTAQKSSDEVFAKSKFTNDQQIKDQLAARDALKSRTDAIRGQSSAMADLTNRYNQQTKLAKDLAAQLGIHNKQAIAAADSSKKLGEQISAINKATGNGAPNTGVGRYAEGIKEFAKQALFAVSAGFGLQGVFEFIKGSVEKFSEAQQAASRLNNILSNLGKQSAIGDLSREAENLSKQFGTFEKKDVTEVFQKLITYGKLTKNQIMELTPVIIDFAAKQGIDLPEATSVLTKALEGQARGLKEYGINVKDGKDSTERLSIIMDQLKPRVDGAAKAFGETLAGGTKKAQIALDELKEEVGEKLTPVTIQAERAWYAFLKTLATPDTSNFDTLVYYLKLIGAAVSGGAAGVAAVKSQRDADLQAIRDKKEYADQLEYINLLKENESKRSVEQVKQDLKDQQVLFKSQYDELQLALKSGNAKTEATKKLAAEASKTKITIDALNDVLTSKTDTSVLGFGGDGAGGKEKKAKELKDFAEEFKKILDQVNEFNQKSLGIDVSPLQKELNSAFQEYDKFFAQITELREKDMKEIAKSQKDGDVTGAQAAAQKLIVTEKSDQDLAYLEIAYQNTIAAIQEKFRKEAEAKRKEQDQKNFAAAVALQKKIQEELKKKSEDFYNDAVARAKTKQLGNDTLKNAIATENAEYAQKVAGLTASHNNGATTDDVFDNQMAQALADHTKTLGEKQSEYAQKAVKNVEAYVTKAEDLLGGLADMQEKSQLNALQKVEDAQQKNYANQVKRINGSTLTEEQKAARLKQLDAERQVQTDENERKKRQIEQEDAKFQKAKTITGIILSTAEGVAKAIPNPLLIAIAAATGAVELAIAAATPIPAYKKGIYGAMFHPGGAAIVGDGYKKELILEPGKDPYYSPAIPTIMSLAKHTQVIPIDKVEEMRRGSMRVNPYGYLTGEKENQITKELKNVKEVLLWQTQEMKKAMAKNNPGQTIINIHPGWDAYINKKVRGKR